MQIKEILINTPWWVWGLLAYLIYCGISLLSSNQTKPQKMLLIPCIFLIWSIYGIFSKFYMPWTALLFFVVALIAGYLLGKIIMMSQPPSTLNKETGMIHRSGSVIPLIIIITSFICLYVLNVYAALHPVSLAELKFTGIFSCASGLSSGLFWGIFVTNLTKAFGVKSVRSTI